MDGSALIRTESVNEPRREIALGQSEGCLQATTETTWHVMLVLLQLRELLRKDLKSTITRFTTCWRVTGLL
jgi:hypothetical protein